MDGEQACCAWCWTTKSYAVLSRSKAMLSTHASEMHRSARTSELKETKMCRHCIALCCVDSWTLLLISHCQPPLRSQLNRHLAVCTFPSAQSGTFDLTSASSWSRRTCHRKGLIIRSKETNGPPLNFLVRRDSTVSTREYPGVFKALMLWFPPPHPLFST